ncbi:hypothetical protein [Roseateles sp.]|uniref:hypothetical protein n=1 Tax=Roseateles sp. TaxID=1971397 RepID=UPI002F41536C
MKQPTARIAATLAIAATLSIGLSARAAEPASGQPGASAATPPVLQPSDEFKVAYEALQTQVRGWVEAQDYEAVIRSIETDSRAGVRLPSGIWRSVVTLGHFGTAFKDRSQAGGGWPVALTGLRAFAERRPAGWLLYAQALQSQAWEARGTGYARDVDRNAMTKFRDLLRETRDTLDQHKSALAGLPDWHALRLEVALESGESEAVRRRVFVEGMLRFPRFHPIYFARMRQLTPQWGGGEEAMLDLLDTVAKSSDPAVADEGMYARLVWLANGMRIGLLQEPRFDAATFDRAVDAVVDRYPAQRNLQRFFLMQCQRGNIAAVRRLLPRLRAPLSDDLEEADAPTRYQYEVCQSWAEGRFNDLKLPYTTRGREAWLRFQAVPDKPDDGLDLERAQARLALQREVELQVSRHGFVALMDRYAADVRGQVRLPGGEWRSALALDEARAALARRAVVEGGWASLLTALRNEADRRPAVHLLHADALRAAAWSLRVNAGEGNLPPQVLTAFLQRLRQARDVLDQHRSALAALPDWHVLRMAVSFDLGEPDAKRQRLFEDAVARFPRYHAIYAERLRQLSPAWGGNEDAMLDLLDQVARAKDPAAADEGMYARLVWEADRLGVLLMVEPRIDAKALNGAIDRLAERDPVQDNLQPFFLMRCLRGDRAGATRLFPMLKSKRAEGITRQSPAREHYATCLDWVKTVRPPGTHLPTGFSVPITRRGKMERLNVDD